MLNRNAKNCIRFLRTRVSVSLFDDLAPIWYRVSREPAIINIVIVVILCEGGAHGQQTRSTRSDELAKKTLPLPLYASDVTLAT